MRGDGIGKGVGVDDIRRGEWPTAFHPRDQIRVGKEGAAEGDKIPSAIANRRLSASAEADDEQLRAIAGAIAREVKLPADGFVVGELVQEALHGKSWTPPPHLCSVPP